MAQKGPAKKKSPLPISTIVTLVIALPVGYWAFGSYRKWMGVKNAIAARDGEMAKLRQSNAALSVVYDNTQLKKFEACNKTADQITINWVAAAYYDERDEKKAIHVFNSDRCQDFKPVVLAAGDNKSVLLRSSQPGCNWDGSVFYYAMRYTQENEESEKYQVNNMVGPYQGFDRDCYTFR